MLDRVFLPFFLLIFSQCAIFYLLKGGVDWQRLYMQGGFGPGSYYPWIYLQCWLILPFVIFLVNCLSIRREPLELLENRMMKRGFDIICSLLFLCILFPIIYVIVGLAIKISSPGPVFFKQKRSGEDGREFWCYKFRSMRVNAQCDTLQATEHDPRKTRIGDLIRKTNVDELPQFINVLKGDMSLVGPRPHMLKHTEEYSHLINKYMVRHFVKPGITGWAQVTGFRGETKELWQMEGRVQRDIWYIEHWTFLLDL